MLATEPHDRGGNERKPASRFDEAQVKMERHCQHRGGWHFKAALSKHLVMKCSGTPWELMATCEFFALIGRQGVGKSTTGNPLVLVSNPGAKKTLLETGVKHKSHHRP